MRRRLPKRIHVPLPDGDARRAMVQHLLKGQRCALSGRELDRIVAATGARRGAGAWECMGVGCAGVGRQVGWGCSVSQRAAGCREGLLVVACCESLATHATAAACLLCCRPHSHCAEGYSCSDLAALCKEAAMQALRELGPAIATTPADAVRSAGRARAGLAGGGRLGFCGGNRAAAES